MVCKSNRAIFYWCNKTFDIGGFLVRISCYYYSKRSMKILLSSDSYYPHPGGVSEYMHFLGKYLEDLDNEVVILAPHYSEPYHDDLKTR